VRRDSVRVRRGSDRVRCSSVGCGVAQLGCGVAQLGCGVAQLVAWRLAVRQTRVQISTGHPREVSATELFSGDGMERSLGECSWM
jgi:hypothetical protein